jgi:hypothetical protein
LRDRDDVAFDAAAAELDEMEDESIEEADA